MKISIIDGYGEEKETAAEQKRFLHLVRELLETAGLPINSLKSERATGGIIILNVPDSLEINDITKSFSKLATALACNRTSQGGEKIGMKFDLMITGCSKPITVLGTIR